MKSVLLVFLSLFIGVYSQVKAQNILTESFDGTTFPPVGWSTFTVMGSPYNPWQRCTGTCGYPTSGGPHSGAGDAWIYNYGDNATTAMALATPALPLQNYSNGFALVSLWIYRYQSTNQAGGVGYATYATNGWDNDKLSVYVNTSQSLNGSPTYLGVLSEYTTPGSFFSSSLTVPTAGWYKYSFPIPTSYTGSPAYVIFQDSSNYGWDIYIDDVSVQWISPCTGLPQDPVITTAPLLAPLCSGNIMTMTATDPNVAANLYNFWQQSTTGNPGTWVNIPNSSAFTYTTPSLTGTMYYRFADSCGVSGLVAYSAPYTVTVNIYGIPYVEDFNTTLNTAIPYCYTADVTTSMQSQWEVDHFFHDASGTAYPAVMRENDVMGNVSSGKNAFFTLPALPLNAGETYQIKFGYERGRGDAVNNVGSDYPENLFLYENFGVQPPTNVTGIPGGNAAVQLFSNVVTTDGHNTASLTFTPTVSGPYFFSWYSNTPHPGTPPSIQFTGGLIAVDSVQIDSFGCNPPVISFQPQNSAVCLNSNTTLSVIATGYNLSYQWYHNGGLVNGAINSIINISNAQYTDSGTYKVVVTGTCGAISSVTSNDVKLKVSAYPVNSVTFNKQPVICAGDSVRLVAFTDPGNSFQWKQDGNFVPNKFDSVLQAYTAGSYQGVVTNAYGCATTSPVVAVAVLSAMGITISPSGSTTFCTGSSVTLTANSTNPSTPDIHYSWLKNGLPMSPADTTNVLTTSTPGVFTIQETGSNGCSVTFPSPVNVVVNGPAAAPAISASGVLSFCLGGFVTLSTPVVAPPAGTQPYTYQWYQNNVAINPISNPQAVTTSYTASASGIYTVDVIQDNCSLSSPADTVNVDAPPTTITNNGTIICSGNTVTLTAPGGPGALTYQWYTGGTPNGPSGQSYSTTVGGTFAVSVTDGFPCTATSSSVAVTVGLPPSAIILATRPTTFCPGDSVTISSNYDTALNYIWNVSPSGLPGSFTALPSISGYANGHYDSTRMFRTSGYYMVSEANGPCQSVSNIIQVTVSPLPMPTISSNGSDSLCPGGSVTLTTQSLPNYTYQWIQDNVDVSGGNSPTLLISSNNVNPATNSSGIRVIATNGVGCTGVAPLVTVSVFSNPYDSIVTVGATTICAGTTITLQAPVITGYSYQWKLNSAPIAGATSATYAAGNAGQYVVDIVNSAGCRATTATPATVSVLPVPPTNVFAASSTTFCIGDSVILSAGTGSGLTYQWQTDSMNILHNIAGATASTYVAASTDSFRAVISNGVCAVGSVVIPVIVRTPPAISIAPAGATTFCAGGSVTLNAGLPGMNYQWKNGAGNINTNGTGQSYTAGKSGSYTVVASDNSCVSASQPVVVTVNPLPTDTVELAHIAGNRNPTCTGTSAILDDKNGKPGFSYQWKFNNGIISSGTGPTFSALDSGLYSFTVTDNNGCVGNSPNMIGNTQVYHVALYGLPNPQVIQNGNGSTLTTGTFVTYQWQLNGVNISGATHNALSITQSGKYKVYVTDGNGCSAYSDELSVGNVGVSNVNQVDVKIYPNPATSIVHIDAPVAVNVTVSGMDGKKVLQGNHATQVDLSGLANGVYLITVYDENNTVIKIDKLVKASW